MLVSVDWLKEHLTDPDVVILDSRPKTMFLYGHLPNAQSLSVEQVIRFDQFGSNLVLEQEKIAELLGNLGIDETKTVVLVGDSMDPSVARIAWTFLYLGHEKTCLLDANVSDLQKYGFEFTKKLFAPKPAKFIPKINNAIRIESDFLKEHLDDFKILDARSPQEFMGGHLPNSKLIPFTEGIGYDGSLYQEKKFLDELFLQNNVSKEEAIVCYCMHGHRASNLFLQLKIAGFENVRLYDGSFVEWNGKKLPLE
ncbi:sulfurtransferase [Nitrosopumilus zosterae]|uniref:Sulfurtransferase n=1 Tax=Nitrosopumilus zosterae TaxID=718286 RepID=A0A2S2KQD7_9ARCH|nr:rhodanese-like domain-containing protein [Nitrosopumilus zosterae]BDQ31463.1 rhodanese-like domain-containing protein [Nitrosopumilus zosterae]GBH33668.1 sulfurtransferase [Nitrosopumilus zosterae]